MRRFLVASTLLLGTLFSRAASANVSPPDTAANGHRIAYATGAVSSEELQALAAEKDNYSVWITTAARGSGAFLSDARVRITDTFRTLVLDQKAIGPWLFVDLPAGLYQVDVTFEDETQHRTLRVGGRRPQQVILYFDAQAVLSPEWRTPFVRSPYASD